MEIVDITTTIKCLTDPCDLYMIDNMKIKIEDNYINILKTVSELLDLKFNIDIESRPMIFKNNNIIYRMNLDTVTFNNKVISIPNININILGNNTYININTVNVLELLQTIKTQFYKIK